MAIKRDLSLLDDSTNKTGGTTIPSSLVRKEVQEFTAQNTTEFIQSDDTMDGGAPPENTTVIGRTYPDIIFEYINNPKVVMTVLTIISILIFNAKILTKEDLVLPLTVSAILNLIWFSPTIVSKTWNQIKRLWK